MKITSHILAFFLLLVVFNTSLYAERKDSITAFNPAIERLPKQYDGLNPALAYFEPLMDKVKLKLKKSEFETTADYEERLSKAKEKMAARFSGVYAFTVWKSDISYDADSRFVTVKSKFEYEINDAELHKLLLIKIPLEYITRGGMKKTVKTEFIRGRSILIRTVSKKTGKYIARNTYNTQVTVEKWAYNNFLLAFKDIYREFDKDSNQSSNFSLTCEMSIEKAKAASKYGKTLLVAKLVEPYIGFKADHRKPKLDDPKEVIIEEHYIVIEPLEYWFYNYMTGEIYHKTKLEKKYDG